MFPTTRGAPGLLAGLLALNVLAAVAGEPAFSKKTHVYKTAGDVAIQADVYRAEDAEVRPVLVWIHGGALIMGSRTGIPGQLLDLCRADGFALVSLDYRLAPEVKLPAIIEDLEDAFRWLRAQGPALLHIDPDRMVVAGGSAGGYLTLMSGFRLQPRPRALVAYWGYGDIDGAWLARPSEHYRAAVPLINKDDAYRAVNAKPLTNLDGLTPDGRTGRQNLYHYLRQNGQWPREVSGIDPAERAKLDPYCPIRNITADYPPTLLIHGTEDTDVPYSLSADMDQALTKFKVPHELITVKGAGHGLSGGDKTLVADANRKAVDFIREKLKAK